MTNAVRTSPPQPPLSGSSCPNCHPSGKGPSGTPAAQLENRESTSLLRAAIATEAEYTLRTCFVIVSCGIALHFSVPLTANRAKAPIPSIYRRLSACAAGLWEEVEPPDRIRVALAALAVLGTGGMLVAASQLTSSDSMSDTVSVEAATTATPLSLVFCHPIKPFPGRHLEADGARTRPVFTPGWTRELS